MWGTSVVLFKTFENVGVIFYNITCCFGFEFSLLLLFALFLFLCSSMLC